MKIRGFLVVLLMGMVVVYFIFFAKVGNNKGGLETMVDARGRAFVKLTEVNMATLSREILSSASEEGLPEDLKEWRRGRTLGGAALDAWGREIRYEKLSDSSFRLRSAGPDGRFDTADDIVKEY